MATYTTTDAVTDYCQDLVSLPSDDDELERLIDRAERDVDRALETLTRDTDTGLRVTPDTDLEAWQQDALSRAVGAQVAYRVQMGPEFFIKDQYEAESGPEGFSLRGRLSRLAPGAAAELLDAGLLASPILPISILNPTATSSAE